MSRFCHATCARLAALSAVSLAGASIPQNVEAQAMKGQWQHMFSLDSVGLDVVQIGFSPTLWRFGNEEIRGPVLPAT